MKHLCEGRDQDVDSADRFGESRGLDGLATVAVIRRRWPMRRVFFFVGGASRTITLLPHGTGGDVASPRFGSVAVRGLVDRVLSLGARRESPEAEMFGGARVLPPSADGPRARHLGDQNVARALAILDEPGIGCWPRKREGVGA